MLSFQLKLGLKKYQIFLIDFYANLSANLLNKSMGNIIPILVLNIFNN